MLMVCTETVSVNQLRARPELLSGNGVTEGGMEGWREGRLRCSRKWRLRHISRGKKVRREKQRT